MARSFAGRWSATIFFSRLSARSQLWIWAAAACADCWYRRPIAYSRTGQSSVAVVVVDEKAGATSISAATDAPVTTALERGETRMGFSFGRDQEAGIGRPGHVAVVGPTASLG